MVDHLAPSFDVERGPVLWGAAVTAIAGAIALFAFQRPGWLFPASVLGGVAAGFGGGYYSQSSTNGLVGVGVGFLALFPVLVVFRALWLGAFPGAGEGLMEFAFVGVVGAITDVAVFGPLFLLCGYLGGAVVGKVQSGPEHSIREFGQDR